jgi:hypothetical protein
MMPEAPSVSWASLHDGTLTKLEVIWESGAATLYVQTGSNALQSARIKALELRRLDCPRCQPWGLSVSINAVRGPTMTDDGTAKRLEVEMQSGDVIVLEAAEFELSCRAMSEPQRVGDAVVWVEQESSILLKAVTPAGDPVELSAEETRELASTMNEMAEAVERI